MGAVHFQQREKVLRGKFLQEIMKRNKNLNQWLEDDDSKQLRLVIDSLSQTIDCVLGLIF